MPRWKTRDNLLVGNDGEMFDPNWMDRPTMQAPMPHPWKERRPIRFEDVDIWEVICEFTGLSGVYAAWCPYAEYYVVMQNWTIVAEFDGPNANSDLERYLIKHKIPYPYSP